MATPATPARRRLVPGNLLTPPSTGRRRTPNRPGTIRASQHDQTSAAQNPPPGGDGDGDGNGNGVDAVPDDLFVERMAGLLSWDHNPLQADPEDCAEDHTFCGQLRPPVGVCLQEILAYLSTPSVFDQADWPARGPYIAQYLDFLEEGGRAGPADRLVDEAGQLLPQPPPPIEYAPPVRGRNTRVMLQEVRRLLQVQQLFEEQKRGVAGKRVVVLTSAAAVPTMQPRQLRFSHFLPAGWQQTDAATEPAAPAAPAAPAVPADTPASATVHRISQHYPYAPDYKLDLAEDDSLLAGEPAQPRDTMDRVVQRARRALAKAEADRNNLAYEENAEYYESASRNRGWVTYVRAGDGAAAPAPGAAGAVVPPPAPQITRQLPDGTVLGQDAMSYARERGARRAALQLALLELPATENATVSGSSLWHRVALPAPASRTRRRLAAAAGHWTPLGAKPTGRLATVPTRWQATMEDGAGATPGQRQTHPYTTCMAAYRHHRLQWMAQARAAVEQQNSRNADWVTLPHFPDAYCSPVAPSRAAAYDRRLLALLRTIARRMERAVAVAPRPLLQDVRKYAEQGLRGQAVPDELLQLRSPYDWHPHAVAAVGTVSRKRVRLARPLVEAEARWLMFLLTESTNDYMVLPLPPGEDLRETCEREGDEEEEFEDEDDLNKQVLYQCFARRLQSCMDDLSETRLFRTAETEVTVKALVDWLNGQDQGRAQEADRLAAEAALAGLPVVPTRVHFSYSDGRFFCDRLSRAGRCRYVPYKYGSRAGSRGGGIVMRPKLTLHPEHRLWTGDTLPAGAAEPGPSWLRREAAAGETDVDMAIGAPRRDLEVDGSWLETVVSGRTEQPLPDGVRTFFCALAFRFGLTLRQLERKEAWRAGGDVPNGHDAMRAWRDEYDRLTTEADVHFDLVDVARAADPAADPDMTTDEARQRIRHGLLVEAEHALQPLAAATTDALAESLWDWARPEVCGVAPRFFDLDRWPRHLQLPKTARKWACKSAVLDPDAVWDPASQDPTPARYLWQPSSETSPFGFQKVKHRPGPAAFLQGETRLQRQAVINDLTDRVARALGYEGVGVWDRLASRVPFLRRDPPPTPATIDDVSVEETSLPAVSASRIPHSADWKARTAL